MIGDYHVQFPEKEKLPPYSLTITSHIFVTFSLAFTLFIGINIIAFRTHKFAFFGFFLPNGAPLIMAPFFIIIEIMSYLSRVFSLSIRLFANMMSGVWDKNVEDSPQEEPCLQVLYAINSTKIQKIAFCM